MRRTTSRSSTRSGSRRASSSRSKRSKRAARPRLSTRQVREIVGVLLMLAALLGVLAILSHAGSILGLVPRVGAWALLIAGLVIGLIVTIHFSPGALLVAAVGGLRAANAERARLRNLVAAPAQEKGKPQKATPASSDLLTRSAASFAT